MTPDLDGDKPRQPPNLLETFARIAQIGGGASVIVGVFAALIGMYGTLDNANRATRSLKLSALAPVNEMIAEDNRVREEIGTFLAAFDKGRLAKLLELHGTGEKAYLSQDLAAFRSIGRHYERLGALVKLGYVDFDLVYEIIPFPDGFWNETADFRQAITGTNWADGKGLPDFWKNFNELGERYRARRAQEH